MEKIKIFVQLTRLDKPIGFLLLFWPCSWGLALGNYFHNETILFIKYTFLFLFGSILMRSAGCIFNDIVDKDFDKKVERTKIRPIASGKISVLKSYIYVFFLCLLSLIILLQFNYLTIILGMGSMLLAFAYPFMKRITYWPQFFLGLTFNWGIIMGWAATTNNISLEPIVLYIGAIFWTLGYDTIYGLQDINDDEIIGIKSTSIKFKNNVKTFVGITYAISALFILYLGFMLQINFYYFMFCALFILSLIYQIIIFKKDNPQSCLKAFKHNNITGILIFLFIFSFSYQ